MYCSRLIHPDAEPEENERTREARVHALVNELPIESWMCQSSRQSASVSELRQRLRHRTGCANASVPSVRVLLEKEDLVNELERAPHDTLCSICYEEYADGEPLRLLRCGHYFHIECIDRWLLTATKRRAPACPLCNRSLDPAASAAATAEAPRAHAGGGGGQGGGAFPFQDRLEWLTRLLRLVVIVCCFLFLIVAGATFVIMSAAPHANPRIRYAAAHADMRRQFIARFPSLTAPFVDGPFTGHGVGTFWLLQWFTTFMLF